MAFRLKDVPFYPDRTEEMRKELDDMIANQGLLELLAATGVFDSTQLVTKAS